MVKGDMIITTPVSENYLIFTTSEKLDAYRLSGLAKAGQLVKLVDLSTNKYKLYILETDMSATGGLKCTEILRRDTYDNTKVKYMILGENDDLPQDGDEKTDYYKLEDNHYIHYRWIDNDYEIISGNSYSKVESDNRYTKTSNGNVPTTSTVGNPGDIIKADDALYECFGTNGTYYIWKKVSFGGGAAFTSEAALRDAIIAGDITAGMSISLLENGKYKNYIIQTVNTTTGAYTKTQSEVVTDVIYSDEDLSEYSSVNSTSNRNQACVVIAPNEVDPYFLKSAQVKTKAGTPVKFSVFGISNFYHQQDSLKRKKFTKVRDIVVINADDDGVARIEFNLPMRFIPDETVLVASCDTSQSSFFYGPYKDAQHTIFNYNYSWFDLQPGEFDSHPFAYNTDTSGYSPYFVLEYVLVSNTTEIKKSAAEILQEQEYFSPYDNFVSDTSENPVQNKVLYEELNITETETIIPEDISFLSGNTHTVSVYTRCAFALFRIGSLDSYYLKKLDIRVKSNVNVKIWTAHCEDYSPGSTHKYIVLDELKDTITSVDTHAVYEPSEPLFIEDPSNTFVVALTDEAGIGLRSIAAGLYSNGTVYIENSSPTIYYDLTTGGKILVLNFNPNYVNPETPPAVSRLNVAYEMVYRLAESKTVTTVTNVKEAVKNLLETAETPPNTFYNPLEGKKWAACGDSITHGVTGVGEEVIPYPNIIADRNGMVLYRDGIEGTTMMQIDASNPGYKQPFCLDRVKSIPKDSDYVTIWFGINDASENGTIGSIDDAVPTTYYGAWNISMQWIITNLPNARIGLVVSHHTRSAYCDVVRNIAKKYGVKVFDIPGDPLIPFWHTSSANASYVDANIKGARMAEWWVNISHPNTKGYEYISNPFENWMRSL